MPTIICFAFDILYGLFLYRLFVFQIDCAQLLPKLQHYVGRYSDHDICYANQYCWTALIVFMTSWLGAIIATIAIYPKKDLANAPDKKKKLLMVQLVFALLTLMFVFSFAFEDINLLAGGTNRLMPLFPIDFYMADQISKLFIAGGTLKFTALASLLFKYYAKNEF